MRRTGSHWITQRRKDDLSRDSTFLILLRLLSIYLHFRGIRSLLFLLSSFLHLCLKQDNDDSISLLPFTFIFLERILPFCSFTIHSSCLSLHCYYCPKNCETRKSFDVVCVDAFGRKEEKEREKKIEEEMEEGSE